MADGEPVELAAESELLGSDMSLNLLPFSSIPCILGSFDET